LIVFDHLLARACTTWTSPINQLLAGITIN